MELLLRSSSYVAAAVNSSRAGLTDAAAACKACMAYTASPTLSCKCTDCNSCRGADDSDLHNDSGQRLASIAGVQRAAGATNSLFDIVVWEMSP